MKIKNHNWYYFLGYIGFGYYMLITIVFYNYITILMLAGITVALPTILLSFRSKNRQKMRIVLKRRIIVTGFILGVITVAFFPNLLRIPSQIYIRLNRTTTLITPDNPTVKDFRDDFLKDVGEERFNNMSMRQKLDSLDLYTMKKIKWTEDIRTVGMSGDLSTPEESIKRGKDDCRGQACVMASVLKSLDMDAWVVEMAWHMWVMVYDDDGKAYKLNHDGHSNTTIQYPITMMWNDEEIKILKDPIGIYNSLMISSPHFYKYTFMLGYGIIILVPLMGLGSALYSSVCKGDFTSIRKKEKEAFKRLKKRFLFGTLVFTILFITLGILFFTPLAEFIGFYLFVYGSTAIVTIMSLEEFI